MNAAATIVAYAVFLLIGIVRVARPEAIHDIAVVFRALIRVLDQQADAGTGGLAFEDTGKYLDLVIFTSLCGMT